MRKILSLSLILLSIVISNAQELAPLKISGDRNYLVTRDNEPFFWLGGTAWELIHRCTKEEIDLYLEDRAEKGFTVIQTVILAELDGLNTPNAYGDKPLIRNDPTRLNEKYFEIVDYAVDRSEALGLYVALLPTWGDKINRAGGAGPEIFNPENAKQYGEILGKRYANRGNIIWVLGGDRNLDTETHYEIIRAMGKGIRKADKVHLMTYHPNGARRASDFFDEEWLNLDMFQSGHNPTREYQYVLDCKKSKISRPVINGEARYENIPDRFWEKEHHGWMDDADVRKSAYWTMLAGAAGYTYGCNDIWQMYDYRRTPAVYARTDWKQALNLPGSFQMEYMKKIFEALPWQSIVLDQSLILSDNPDDQSYIVSAMGRNKDFAMVYTPTGRPATIDMSKFEADNIVAYWFNPRSGTLKSIGEYKTIRSRQFKPWADGRGSDFFLILVNKTLDKSLSGFNAKYL